MPDTGFNLLLNDTEKRTFEGFASWWLLLVEEISLEPHRRTFASGGKTDMGKGAWAVLNLLMSALFVE